MLNGIYFGPLGNVSPFMKVWYKIKQLFIAMAESNRNGGSRLAWLGWYAGNGLSSSAA